MTKDPVIALWPINLSLPVESLDAWCEIVRVKAVEARTQGADILVLPEYACVHWMFFAPVDVKGPDQLPWMASLVDEAVAKLQVISTQVGIDILAGTLPVAGGDNLPPTFTHQPNDTRTSSMPRYYNRAVIIRPDGDTAYQDKLSLTPWELDEKSWNIHQGGSFNSFMLGDAKCAVLVCLDVEQPALSLELIKNDIDLLIVPSMTSLPSGYMRVFACARARAIEAMCAVAAVGAVGVPEVWRGKETNYSGAGLFVPCEASLKPDGIVAEIAAGYETANQNGAGDLLVATVPVAAIKAKKKGQAEAWPGLLTVNG